MIAAAAALTIFATSALALVCWQIYLYSARARIPTWVPAGALLGSAGVLATSTSAVLTGTYLAVLACEALILLAAATTATTKS